MEKKWRKHSSHRYKAYANYSAEDVRAGGYKARVVKRGKKWVVERR